MQQAMATTSKAKSVTLKLLIDSKGQTVLFAEAGKEFADFLFTLLSLPISTVIRLLSSDAMVGALGKLYESFANLNDTYLLPKVDKETLLIPNLSNINIPSPSATLLSLTCNNKSSSSSTSSGILGRTTFYSCEDCQLYVSVDPRTQCPNCKISITNKLTYVAPPWASDDHGVGFVKDVITYMIMDDLEVKPMSSISSIAILNKFNVKDVGALEEKTVSVGLQEGLKLLHASLRTKTVLTTVFLGK